MSEITYTPKSIVDNEFVLNKYLKTHHDEMVGIPIPINISSTNIDICQVYLLPLINNAYEEEGMQINVGLVTAIINAHSIDANVKSIDVGTIDKQFRYIFSGRIADFNSFGDQDDIGTILKFDVNSVTINGWNSLTLPNTTTDSFLKYQGMVIYAANPE